MLSTWGAKSGDLADLKRLTEALASFDDLSVSAFCKQLGGSTFGGATTTRTKVPGKTKLDESLVEHYVAAFCSEALDYATLQSTLEDLGADPKARGPELSAIASRLAGAEGKYNKAKALEKIEAVVRRRLDTRRRMEGTSGVF
jgi:hypothetical protein